MIQKGNFFSELERLKCLDFHRQQLEKIQSKDAKKAVRASVERIDHKKTETDKRKRQDMLQNSKCRRCISSQQSTTGTMLQ